jgi:hypothetical protein
LLGIFSNSVLFFLESFGDVLVGKVLAELVRSYRWNLQMIIGPRVLLQFRRLTARDPPMG